jgi:uncharacterized protein YndB with AHSA1/START domain
MADIKHLLRIEASTERVYLALTTAEGIRKWWTKHADLEEFVGGTGQFRFNYEKTVVTEVTILQLQKNELVSWQVVSSFRPEQVGTTISFVLKSDKSGTFIFLTQAGFKEADETYALMTTGWAYYLVSLQQYLETGEGAPSPDVRFDRMIRPPKHP